MRESFSVIIPVYNTEEQLIERSVKSALQFDEILLVDDGSKPETAHFMDKLAEDYKQLRVIHQVNGGVSSARNHGIREAAGDRILFLDADDYFAENLMKQLEHLDYDCICFGFRKIAKQITEFDNRNISGPCTIDRLRELSTDTDLGLGMCWNKVYSKEILINNQIFFNQDLSFGEDCEFVYRYYNVIQSAIILEGSFYNYMMNTGSATQHYNPRIPEEYLKTMRCILKNTGLPQKLQRKVILDHLIFTVFKESFHPQKGNYFYCRRKLAQILRTDIYSTALKEIDYKEFGTKKKIILFGLKYRFYLMEYILTRINYARK